MPQADENRRLLLLYFAEMKIIKGEYHVIPRTKPSEVI